MRGYVALLRLPGVLGVTASQLFARLPLGVLSLAVLLHVQTRSGSYALAGAVVACVSIGEAIAMPVTGRLAGRFGMARTLLTTAAVNAAATVALALAGPKTLLIPLGLVVGASIPPIMPVLRALYPQLVPPDALRALFALDTTAQELIWIIGPVIATLLASAVSTALPLLLCAVITVGGTGWLLANRPMRTLHVEPSASSFGRALNARAVILAMVASATLVASFMALEVGVVADYGPDQALAGVALAVSGVGSLVGGLVLGHRRLSVRGLVLVLTVVVVGTACSGLAPDRILQVIALFFAGFGFAPSMSTLYVAASRAVEAHAAPEVFGWLTTASLAGGASGTALAGVTNDAFGTAGSFAAATLLALVAAVSPVLATLRGPMPELSA
ncbi:MFS transporter [Mycolicibacterium madagascariense]|uniref:MFS transporter n=1 Tax=Mycolicibacterium madagascariense TaxID=212765 RepID=A0A7I7XJA3_9MYCO|nr:MFS transporter [Mycolicibacterium madagascariense]MCV7013824.1 MFS transporter [Mycolicibacterium madagascariense]BBZ29270.1 MFS transporter [Mycolicibacterium madagascariense]